MDKRYDVMSPKKRGDKTFWARVGTAWDGDKGIRIDFDSLPLPDAEGRCSVFLFEPRERDSGTGGGGRGNQSRAPAAFDADLDDDVPFMTRDGIW